MCRQGAAEYNFGQELKEEIEAIQNGKLSGNCIALSRLGISVLTTNLATDFRSGGPFSGVPAAPVEEDDEQEGERRQRRLEGGHEGLSDIGESTFGTDNSFLAGFPF